MSSDSVFRQLLLDRDNSRCFDCYHSVAQWASVSHGIFLCLECSGQHKSLGTHISFVRSINMDLWSPIQLHIMQIGGNRRFREFLNSYELPTSYDIMDRYYTRASDYYRQLLKAESEGRRLHFPPPGQAEGIEPFTEMPRPSYLPPSSNYELYDPQSAKSYRQNSSGFWGNTKNFFGVVFEKTSEMATNTASNLIEQGFLVALKDATITTLVKSKEIFDDIKESDSYNSVKEKSKQMLSAVSHKASNVFTKSQGNTNYESLEDFTFGGDSLASQIPTEDENQRQRSSLFLESLRSESVPISQSYFLSRNSAPFPESSSPSVAIRNTVQLTDSMRFESRSSSKHDTLDLLTGD